MKLFGVVHSHEHLDRQIAEIEQHGIDGKSMMLELAPNYDALVSKRETAPIRKPFFVALREQFRSRCSRVICGDQDLTIPDNPEWILAALLGEDYFYPDNHRDRTMANVIKAEKPDIVVVGNGHSEYLKSCFPEADHTVFQPEHGYPDRYGRRRIWHNADQIISL